MQWARINYEESKDANEYLNKILNEFKTNDFYYSLTPGTQGNDYANFFFNTKNGYCEYYAGTFAILARLAGIPSRIVTGYYGGSYNEIGNFYTFKQQDAHSWVEIFINDDWVLYDPTLSVPSNNILNSNNNNFDSFNTSSTNNFETGQMDINKIGIYFEYINYIWTNSFIRYDEKSRSNFIKEKLTKANNYKYFLTLIFFSIFVFYVTKALTFINSKKFLFTLFFKKLRKENKNISEFMTHQEIFSSLNIIDQHKYKILFDFYEKLKFSKDFKVSIKNFYEINIKILKYAYFKK